MIVGLVAGLALSSLIAAAPAGATAPAPVLAPAIPIGDDLAGPLALAAGHLFVATNPNASGGKVVVRAVDGSDVGVVADVDGAFALVAAADGERVYAVSHRTRSIDVIDAEEATRVASYVLPEGCSPDGLADLGSTVWFSYGYCGGDSQVPTDAGVGVIDMTAETPAAVLVTRDRIWDPPLIGGDPSAPTSLVVTSDATNMAVQRYSVSGTTLTPAGTLTPPGCPPIYGLPVDHDGVLRVLCPTATTSEVNYHVDDLGPAGSLPAGSPLAGGVPGPDGLVAVTYFHPYGSYNAWRVYSADGTFRKGYRLDTPSRMPRAVIWDADGGLYGVSDDSSGGSGHAELHLLGPQGGYGTQLVVSAPRLPVPMTSPMVVTGTVISADLDPAAKAGRQVAVTRIRTTDDTSVALPAVTTTSTGAFTIVDRAPVGYYRYAVSLPADAGHDGAQATSEIVTVSRGAPTLALTVSPAAPRLGQVVTVRARLSSPLRNRTISIYVSTAGHYSGPRRLLRSQVAAPDGTVTVTYRVLQTMQFTATTVPDTTYLPGLAWTLAKVAPTISLRQRGYYRTSGGYRLYHHRTNPRIGYEMNPWPGELYAPAEWTLQRYRSGHWSTVGVVRYRVDLDSGIVVRASRVGRGTYRVRLRNLGLDGYSSVSVSSWTYFRIVT